MKLLNKLNLRALALIATGTLLFVSVASTNVRAEEGGKKAEQKSEDQCKHDAPKSECFVCNPKLREKGRLWCKEHDRYEDRCWECHPEKRDKKRLYCKEHSLYEDECFFCHPELKKKKVEKK